jgi:hypothetical protein
VPSSTGRARCSDRRREAPMIGPDGTEVHLTTWISRGLRRRIRVRCVEEGASLHGFVAAALQEKLAREQAARPVASDVSARYGSRVQAWRRTSEVGENERGCLPQSRSATTCTLRDRTSRTALASPRPRRRRA